MTGRAWHSWERWHERVRQRPGGVGKSDAEQDHRSVSECMFVTTVAACRALIPIPIRCSRMPQNRRRHRVGQDQEEGGRQEEQLDYTKSQRQRARDTVFWDGRG